MMRSTVRRELARFRVAGMIATRVATRLKDPADRERSKEKQADNCKLEHDVAPIVIQSTVYTRGDFDRSWSIRRRTAVYSGSAFERPRRAIRCGMSISRQVRLFSIWLKAIRRLTGAMLEDDFSICDRDHGRAAGAVSFRYARTELLGPEGSSLAGCRLMGQSGRAHIEPPPEIEAGSAQRRQRARRVSAIQLRNRCDRKRYRQELISPRATRSAW
jgi:hypothetical protein